MCARFYLWNCWAGYSEESEKELDKAMQEHPDLMDKCAEEIQARLWESSLMMDEMDYQRLVEVEEYNCIDDL